MASWLGCQAADRAVLVRALAGNIVVFLGKTLILYSILYSLFST